MRSRHVPRRSLSRRKRRSRRFRGGAALIGLPHTMSSMGNHYAYNSIPKLGYPVHNTHQKQTGGGHWYDMFDPRMRPIQPLWSVTNELTDGVKSAVGGFMGKYPTPSSNPLTGHFQK